MYVFLDIDGVLATEATWDDWVASKNRDDAARHRLLDPICVGWVQRLCDELSAQVVVSSSWRRLMALEELVAVLARGGLAVNVVGATPVRDDFDRGAEIADWMATNEVEAHQVLILEDAEEVYPLEHRVVRPWFCGDDAGFRAPQYEEALRLLEQATRSGDD